MMPLLRHFSQLYYVSKKIMADKKTEKTANILCFYLLTVAMLLVTFAGMTVAQTPVGNQPAQQTWPLRNISAESAKQILLREMGMEVVVQVDTEANSVNVIGPAQAVLSAIDALKERDKPGATVPYLNSQTNRQLNNQSSTLYQGQQPSQPPMPLSRTDETFSQPFAVVGDGSNTRLTFTDPRLNTSFPNLPTQGNNTAESYEAGTYFCKPSHLAMMNRELLARYGHDRNISLQTVPDSSKILVWAPQRVQREITGLMTQSGAWAEVPPGRDLREFDGTVIRVAADQRPPDNVRQPMVERTHATKYATLEQIEAKLQVLFGNRLVPMSTANEPAKRYRITIPRPSGTAVCDLLLDSPNYQISVRATQNLADDMLRLLQLIDQPAPEQGRDRRFISIQNSDPDQIRKLLDVYRTKAVPNSSRRMRNNPNMMAYQQNGNPAHNPVRQVNYQDDGGLGGLGGASPAFGMGQIPGLEGIGTDQGNIPYDPAMHTRIQVLTEMDVVIIDAPLEEVKRIIDLIDQIQKLVADAQSTIELMPLKHIQCEALDQLLQTQIRTSVVTMPGQMPQPVYLVTEMLAMKQGRVWVLPLINPNAMLIVGWGEAREAMKSLIEHLDQPVEAENSLIRVIPLEFAPVTQVATALTDFFTPSPVFGPGGAQPGFYPQIRIISDPRTNTLIVQAAPNDYKDILRIIAEIDVGKGKIKLQVKTFKMKNLMAGDMMVALNAALAMAMNGTADNRFPVIELPIGDGAARRIFESGFLTEVTIEAIDANNTLVVTAPGISMPLIEELINMLDESPGVAMVKVIPIEHGDASTLLDTLQTIFPTQQAGTANTVSLPNAEGGDIFIPLRFGRDDRTNSILVAGAQSEIMFIETLIAKLDKKDALQRETKAYPLRNSSAADVLAAIDPYLRQLQTLQDMEDVSQHQRMMDAIIVEAEPVSNILIINASLENMKVIEKLIEDLDKEPLQVTVQVLIAEVTLSSADEFGIELGLQDPYLFQRSTVSTGGYYNFADPNIGLGNSTTPESLATAGTVATQLLSNFGTGRVNSDSGFGGMVFSASSDAVSVLIRAMQERGHAEVLSRPQITAQDNQLAIIFVGQNILRSRGSESNNYGISTNSVPEDVGLFLGIVPRISEGTKTGEPDRITMLISASKSSLGSANDGMATVVNNTIVRAPNVNKIRTETIVSALDGETVLLGGLITTDKQEINRRVPFLSNIPIAGNLFKYQYEKQKRTELIIIMRPRIVRRTDDMDAIKRAEFARMNWCLADVTKLHGDIGVYSPMARQPVTGGAPSFAPEPVDMSQLRDLPMPQRMTSGEPYNPTITTPNNVPNGLQIGTPTYMQPGSAMEPTPMPTIAPQPAVMQPVTMQPNAPPLPMYSTVVPDVHGRY